MGEGVEGFVSIGSWGNVQRRMPEIFQSDSGRKFSDKV